MRIKLIPHIQIYKNFHNDVCEVTDNILYTFIIKTIIAATPSVVNEFDCYVPRSSQLESGMNQF